MAAKIMESYFCNEDIAVITGAGFGLGRAYAR